MEYTITLANTWFTGAVSGTAGWTENIKHASVFKSKSRAESFAKKFGGNVELFWGAGITSSKSTVAPKQSPINRSSAYRSM